MIIIEYRIKKITFRVTTSESQKIESQANKANMTISEFVRYSSLNKEIIVIEDIKELSKEVKAIGKNLNQLTILCHQGKIVCPNIGEIEKKLDKVWYLLNLLTVKMRNIKD